MTRRLVAALLVLTALRLLLIGRHDLSPDEAYYLLWSQRLDLAYYSKGPGIALLLRAVTSIFGTSETAVRLCAPLLALATTLLLFVLARRLFGERTALWTAITLQFVPIFNAGALLMTIDPLSIASWMATLVLAQDAMRREGSAATTRWLLVGLACGAGIVAKYTNLLALAGVMLAVLLSAERRRHVRGLLVATTLSLLALVPALVWNASHGWATATHLAERGALDRGAWLRPKETLEFLVVHFGTYSPLIFLGVLLALPAAFRRARTDGGTRFLLAAAAPVLVMYLLLALHEAGEPNWTAPGMLCLLPLAVDHWLAKATAARRGLRVACAAALVVGGMLSIVIVETDVVRAVGIELPARKDPSTRLRGWSATANEVAKLRRRIERESPGVLLIANHYGVASELARYLPRAPVAFPGHPAVYVPPTRAPKNQYWFWPGLRDASAGLEGRDALFVSDRSQPPPEDVTAIFAGGCEPLDSIEIERRGEPLRTIRPWLCRDLTY